jgi:monofunctional biosynthetic peptidoglycan transglycosylase
MLKSWFLRLSLGLSAVLLLTMGYQAVTWPDVAVLARQDPKTTAFVERYREAERRQGKTGVLRWQMVPYEAISVHLKRAVVAGEDLEFFSHHGFSTAEMRRAIEEAVKSGRPLRGASTITQQLAKNLWLSPSRNPLRKLKEAVLTIQLEKHLSKRRILELYLNVVEFGPGIYGAEAAARYYFGKAAAELDEREAVLLAASLPRPRTWNPGNRTPSYLRYAAEIERRMARATFLWRAVGAAPP